MVGAVHGAPQSAVRPFSPTLAYFSAQNLFPVDASPSKTPLETSMVKLLTPLIDAAESAADVEIASIEASTAALTDGSAVLAPAIPPQPSDRGTSSNIARAESQFDAARTPTRQQQAELILARHINRYPILEGTTVEFGDAQGHQAISYYTIGRIVISPDHRAGLEEIIEHEVWHVIDWRDNGRIDWGESIPPKNAEEYVGLR
jgi:hypothetical protein